MEPVTLRTGRLVLSPLVETDTDAIHRYCQDSEIQRYTTAPVPYTEGSARYFVNEYAPEGWRDGTECVLAIRLAGRSASLGVISWQRPRNAIGYWLGREHRGRGYMSEALRAMSEWILAPSNDVDAVHWEASAGNIGSATVARSAGFRWVGEAPCHVANRDGKHPWGWHAVLRPDHLGSVEPITRWPVLA